MSLIVLYQAVERWRKSNDLRPYHQTLKETQRERESALRESKDDQFNKGKSEFYSSNTKCNSRPRGHTPQLFIIQKRHSTDIQKVPYAMVWYSAIVLIIQYIIRLYHCVIDTTASTTSVLFFLFDFI